MIDDQDRCKWANVSSDTGSHGQSWTKGCKTLAAAAAAAVVVVVVVVHNDLVQMPFTLEMHPVYDAKCHTRPAVHVCCKMFACGQESVVDEE